MAFPYPAAFDLLLRSWQSNRLGHAYLITGATGSGKRPLASRLAWLVRHGNGEEPTPGEGLKLPEVFVISPESKSRQISVDQTRELERALQMRSSTGGRKVGIIMEADRLGVAAANSFLKTLEEPPANTLLLLLSAHPEMLLDTILSRCIQVALLAPTGETLSQTEQNLLERLDRDFAQGEPAGIAGVFGLVSEFNRLLSASKQMIEAESEEELKKEIALYKQTTDGKWLEGREKYFKALTESRYLRTRNQLVDRLLQWWGDALRCQHGVEHRDFPTAAVATQTVAARYPTPEILRRVSALEELRRHLNTNVQEALAIEVAFLKAFSAAA